MESGGYAGHEQSGAAAAGQADLDFLQEDHSASKPREDVRGLIRGVRQVPQECKVEYAWKRASDEETIDANAEPIGKLFQVGTHVSASIQMSTRLMCAHICPPVLKFFVWFGSVCLLCAGVSLGLLTGGSGVPSHVQLHQSDRIYLVRRFHLCSRWYD